MSFALKTTANNESRVAMANFIRDDLAKVGVRVTLVLQEFNGVMANLQNDYQYEVILVGNAVRRPDPVFGGIFYKRMLTRWLEDAPANVAQRRADELISLIGRATNKERRMDAWRELHTIVNDEAWVVWLPVQSLKAPIRDRFGNVRPSPVKGGAISITWNAEEFFVKAQQQGTN